MKYMDNRQAWLIFDTCTRPQYYQDVHNILALPENAVMRYEYRERHIAAGAVGLLAREDAVPGRIVFIYVQPSDYVRGGTAPASGSIPDYSEGIVVGTRLGHMVNIVREGETVYFDFVVGAYPSPVRHLYDALLKPLSASQEMPFNKWVTVAELGDAWKDLGAGTAEANWEGIVDVLDRAPSQFAGDVFWRVKRVARDPSGKSLQVIRRTNTGGKGSADVRRIGYGYELKEDQNAAFDVVSYTSGTTDSPDVERPRRLAVETSDRCPMNVLGPNHLDLRPHSAELLRVGANREGTLLPRQGTVSIRSSLREDGYPIGPRLDFLFTVQKRFWETTLGFVCLLLSVAAHVATGQVVQTDLAWGIVLGVTTAILLAVGVLVMTNRLPTKLR